MPETKPVIQVKIHPYMVDNAHRCATCRHSHFAFANADVLGACLRTPPLAMVMGYAPQNNILKMDQSQAPQVVPIVQGRFPPVMRDDTCSEWTNKELCHENANRD